MTSEDVNDVAPEVPAESTKPEIDPSRLDADAVRVVLRLRQSGYQAYLVGGCVRDLLIGRTPKDFDIATSATPNQVRSLFRNCRLIGRRFRLAHVYFKGGKILEVSTFRANPAIVEDPQPSEAIEGEVASAGTVHIAEADQEAMAAVELGTEMPSAPVSDVVDEEAAPSPAVSGLEDQDDEDDDDDGEQDAPGKDLLITEDNTFGTEIEDALRRDFTINGLFYDPMAGKVIDHVNGLRDLSVQEIRTIGDPEKRLREDPVRILRAVRFAAKIEFELESRTYAAMEGAVEDLPRCSAPRLLEETFRLIRGGTASPAMKLLLGLDALKMLLPPVDAFLRTRTGDVSATEQYFKFVSVMDEMINSNVAFDDSMLLASILLPLALAEPELPAGAEDTGQPVSVARAVELLLNELVQKARLPRRIAERCRMILMAQRTMAGLRRRRGGLGGFRGHPLFNESLKVFEVWVRATNEHREALEKWKAGAAPNPTTDAPGPRRRRRRRVRGERPEGSAAADGSSPPNASDSEAPQASAPEAAPAPTPSIAEQ